MDLWRPSRRLGGNAYCTVWAMGYHNNLQILSDCENPGFPLAGARSQFLPLLCSSLWYSVWTSPASKVGVILLLIDHGACNLGVEGRTQKRAAEEEDGRRRSVQQF